MKIAQRTKLAKKQSFSFLARLLIGLGSCSVAQAMSTLDSVTIEPQWPDSTNPGPVVLYTVTVTRAGQGELDVTLSVAGLPDGATGVFSPSVVRFTGQVPSNLTATLTVTCTNVMPVDPYPFTVTADDLLGMVMTTTNTAGLTFDAAFAANPASRPHLRANVLGKQNMKIRGRGATGKKYEILVSPTLTNPSWTSIGHSCADGNGRFSFLDPDDQKPWIRFYRALAVP